MHFETRIQIVDKDGKGQNLDLSLLVYDVNDRQWRNLTELLDRTNAELKRSRRAGTHIFKANIEGLDEIFNFKSLPYIRVTRPDDDAVDGMPKFIDVVANIRQSDEDISLDFGTALFLGAKHGFVTGSAEQPYFCQGVSAPLNKDRLKALASLYFNPDALATLEDKLSACRASHQSLEETLEKRDAAIDDLTISKDEIAAQLANSQVKLLSQARKIKTLTEDKSKLQRGLRTCRSVSKQKDQNIAALNAAQEELKIALAQCQDDMKALQAAFDKEKEAGQKLARELKDKNKVIKTLTATRKELEAKNAQCQTDMATLQTALDNATQQNGQLNQELAKKIAEITGLETKLAETQIELGALRDDKTALTLALADCNKSKRALGEDLRAAKEAEARAKKDLQKSTDALADLKEKHKICEKKLGEEIKLGKKLADEVKVLEEINTELAAAIKTQNQTEEEWRKKTKDLRIALVTQTAKAEVNETRLGQVRDQIKKAVKTKDVIASIGLDASRAAESLREKGLPYRLGRLHLNMKTIMMPDGKSLYLPDVAVSASDTALTEIDIELLPDEDVLNNQSGDLQCPNLLGLTKTAVISTLMALGLKQQSSIATVTKENEHGRALRQIPSAGEIVVPGTIIRVIYGQHNERGVL